MKQSEAARRRATGETYNTDEEFEAVVEPLLEKLLGVALEALLRGKDQPAPEWSG